MKRSAEAPARQQDFAADTLDNNTATSSKAAPAAVAGPSGSVKKAKSVQHSSKTATLQKSAKVAAAVATATTAAAAAALVRGEPAKHLRVAAFGAPRLSHPINAGPGAKLANAFSANKTPSAPGVSPSANPRVSANAPRPFATAFAQQKVDNNTKYTRKFAAASRQTTARTMSFFSMSRSPAASDSARSPSYRGGGRGLGNVNSPSTTRRSFGTNVGAAAFHPHAYYSSNSSNSNSNVYSSGGGYRSHRTVKNRAAHVKRLWLHFNEKTSSHQQEGVTEPLYSTRPVDAASSSSSSNPLISVMTYNVLCQGKMENPDLEYPGTDPLDMVCDSNSNRNKAVL